MTICKWKAVFAVATAVLLAATGAWATGEEEEGSSGAAMSPSDIDTKPVYGGNLTTADNTWSSVWDPTVLIHGIQVVPAIYDQLFEYDITQGPRGTGEWGLNDFNWQNPNVITFQVIESNEVISPTQLRWKIRRGIHYHDRPPANGREMTVEDVLVTWEHVTAEPRSGLMYKGDELLKMTADPNDPWAINVELAAPDSLGLWVYLTSALNGVLPAEWWRDDSINREDWRNHMGSGPFWPIDVVEGSHITYTRNPNYWMEDPLNPGNQLPYLDTMQIISFADGAARIAALRSGKLDRQVQNGLTPTQIDDLRRSNPEIRTNETWAHGQYAALRADLAPWNDIRVRQAAMLAVDHEALREFFTPEHYHYPGFPVKRSAGKPQYHTKADLDAVRPDLARLYEYHPDEAERLLDEAGYPRGEDGIRFETTFITDSTLDENYPAYFAYFEDVGIRVNMDPIPNGGHWGMIGGADGPNDEHFTGLAFHNAGGTSFSVLATHFWNAPYRPFYSMGRIQGTPEALEVERLFEKVNLLEANTPEWTEALLDLVFYWQEQLWFLDFGAVHEYMAWQPWVKGMEGMSGLQTYQYHFTKYFWIDAALKKELSGRDADE